MTDRERAGLCATCAHVRLVASSRGVVFYLCEHSTLDPSFPKYPVIPVRVCVAYREMLKAPA